MDSAIALPPRAPRSVLHTSASSDVGRKHIRRSVGTARLPSDTVRVSQTGNRLGQQVQPSVNDIENAQKTLQGLKNVQHATNTLMQSAQDLKDELAANECRLRNIRSTANPAVHSELRDTSSSLHHQLHHTQLQINFLDKLSNRVRKDARLPLPYADLLEDLHQTTEQSIAKLELRKSGNYDAFHGITTADWSNTAPRQLASARIRLSILQALRKNTI